MRSEIEMLESKLESDLRSQCAVVERDYISALETTHAELEHIQTAVDRSGSDGGVPGLGPGSGRGRGAAAGSELVGFAESDEEGLQKTCWRAEAVSEAADCTLDKLLGLKAYSVQWDSSRVQQALTLLKQLGKGRQTFSICCTVFHINVAITKSFLSSWGEHFNLNVAQRTIENTSKQKGEIYVTVMKGQDFS